MIDDEKLTLKINDIRKDFYTSASARKVAGRCGRKFVFKEILKSEGKNEFVVKKPALTGQALHSLIEATRLGYDNPIAYAKQQHPEIPDKAKDQHCWQNILLTYKAYIKKYPINNERKLYVSDEFGPGLELYWKENLRFSKFIDKGFIDRIETIEEENNSLLGIDIKTSSMDVKSEEWVEKWKNDIQFALYVEYLRTINSSVKGIMVDGIRHTKNNRAFSRLYFYCEENVDQPLNETDVGIYYNCYTEEKCKAIIEEYDQHIINAFENPLDYNKNACFDFGGCEFLDVCSRKKPYEFLFEHYEIN